MSTLTMGFIPLSVSMVRFVPLFMVPRLVSELPEMPTVMPSMLFSGMTCLVSISRKNGQMPNYSLCSRCDFNLGDVETIAPGLYGGITNHCPILAFEVSLFKCCSISICVCHRVELWSAFVDRVIWVCFTEFTIELCWSKG